LDSSNRLTTVIAINFLKKGPSMSSNLQLQHIANETNDQQRSVNVPATRTAGAATCKFSS
jgi:hypothetical protein